MINLKIRTLLIEINVLDQQIFKNQYRLIQEKLHIPHN